MWHGTHSESMLRTTFYSVATCTVYYIVVHVVVVVATYCL